MLCPDCRTPIRYDWSWCAFICSCLVNRDGFEGVARMWRTDEQEALGDVN